MRYLVANASIPTPNVSAAVLMPIRCDESGDIFARIPEPSDLAHFFLSQIGRDGKQKATFDPFAAANDGLKNVNPKAFTVNADGAVYQLVKSDHLVVLLKFASDGQYLRSLTLSEQFEPEQLAVYNNDQFIAAGVKSSSPDRPSVFSPYLAIFDSGGKFIQQVDLRAAPNTRKGINNSGAAPRNQNLDKGGLRALGILESDGQSVYLLTPGTPPGVIVISAAGVVDRRMVLSPPPGMGPEISAFRVGPGQMLVEYVQPGALPNGNARYAMSLYSTFDGEKIADYERDPAVTGALACTDWRENFSFLSSDEKGPVLLKASTR